MATVISTKSTSCGPDHVSPYFRLSRLRPSSQKASPFSLALPTFRPELPAARVDESLRQALTACDQARHCALLWFCEVLSRDLFRELGYASIQQYAAESLGFSPNRTWQFLRLARDLDRLPQLRQAVQDGRLEWTKAQQVARIATPQTARRWVARAERCSRRELAQGIEAARVAAKRPAATMDVTGQAALPLAATTASVAGRDENRPPMPVRVSVTLSFDSLEAARLEALVEAAKKSGAIAATATREEAILAGLAALLQQDGGGAPELEHAPSPNALPGVSAQETPLPPGTCAGASL